MTWMKLEASLYGHPKVRKLARRLEIEEATAYGHLVLLWIWTVRIAPDGELSSFDFEDIALACQWTGDAEQFVRALVAVRLLDETTDGLIVHDWMERAERYKRSQQEQARRQQKRHGGTTGVQSGTTVSVTDRRKYGATSSNATNGSRSSGRSSSLAVPLSAPPTWMKVNEDE